MITGFCPTSSVQPKQNLDDDKSETWHHPCHWSSLMVLIIITITIIIIITIIITITIIAIVSYSQCSFWIRKSLPHDCLLLPPKPQEYSECHQYNSYRHETEAKKLTKKILCTFSPRFRIIGGNFTTLPQVRWEWQKLKMNLLCLFPQVVQVQFQPQLQPFSSSHLAPSVVQGEWLRDDQCGQDVPPQRGRLWSRLRKFWNSFNGETSPSLGADDDISWTEKFHARSWHTIFG